MNDTSTPVSPTDTFTTKIDWLLFVEPRLGYSWDRTMVFVKGGWAGGDATLSATGPAGGGIATARADDFVDGWTIGGGLEYAWHPSFIVGVEYQYVQLDLGTAASCDLCLIGIPIGDAFRNQRQRRHLLGELRASYLFRPED